MRYKTAKDFADEVTDVLKKHEIQNNLLFLNINGGLSSEDNSNMNMATVKDNDGRLLLTAVQTPPFPMVLYETDNAGDASALEFFAASLAENGMVIEAFSGIKELAARFCEIYAGITGKSFYNNLSMILYVIEKANTIPSLPSGGFRKADENDMFYMPYWYADFEPACKLGDYDLAVGTGNAKRFIEQDMVYIWEDGVPVSTAASTRRLSSCAFINQVYTPPYLRGKGYSTACVCSLTKNLLDGGFARCALFADRDNPYSNKVYRKIGYEELLSYDQYTVKQD